MIEPINGSRWVSRKHPHRMVYTVVGVSNTAFISAEYPPQVVYRGANGFLWTKPLDTWHEKMQEYM